MSDFPVITDIEAGAIGRRLAELVALEPLSKRQAHKQGLSDSDIGRYLTSWGTKTDRGLYLTIKRMIDNLEASVIAGRD